MHRLLRRIVKTSQWLRGLWYRTVVLSIHRMFRLPLKDVSQFARRIPLIERREYSQNGEDGMLEAIFGMIGTTNRFGVEFGVEDGIECNMRALLKHHKWKGLLMDGSNESPERFLSKEFITAENIESLFQKYNVPEEFDLLSIDIDGNDYWVWKAIEHFRPRVVIMEYNAHIPPSEAKTIPYNASFQWDKTQYYGVSLKALEKLGREKGYTLIATDPHGVNSFFVRDELIAGNFVKRSLEEIYRAPNFKGKGISHPPDVQNRPWVTV